VSWFRSPLILFIVLLTGVRLLNAWALPPIQDEAYYFYWSRFLDWGYFDHPPAVSWLASSGVIWPSSTLAARAGTLLLSLLAFPILISLFRRMGLRDAILIALILATSNIGGILFGYITTPDIPLIFCWIAALHEAAAALQEQPKRWLSAGFFTGLGILGKYTMVLIGPVFLIALLFHPKRLKQIWPYLGGVVCVLTLVPHLLWLAHNDWITVRFQFGRGLKSEYGVAMQSGSRLPLATEAAKTGPAAEMARYFVLADDEKPVPKKVVAPWVRYLQGFGNYLGSQAGIWGLLLLPLFYGVWRGRRPALWPSPALKALAWSSALVPVLLFVPLSPVQHIEANWPAMYLIGAAIVLTQHLRLSVKALMVAATLNLALSLLVTAHAHYPLQDRRPHRDRLLRETHGYQDLGNFIAELGQPVFVDTYQNLSQLAFYQPQLMLQVWPGIARSSELNRRVAMNPLEWKDLEAKGRFYLLTDNFLPPAIPGAEVEMLEEIIDCFGANLAKTRAFQDPSYHRPCDKRVHRWSLVTYRLTAE
jgi:4-amino-4-deoxy-L-arabinose transferase-like glycosyltransferase